MRFLTNTEVLSWIRFGRLLYSNVNVKGDFLYGQRIAKKIFWRFYLIM